MCFILDEGDDFEEDEAQIDNEPLNGESGDGFYTGSEGLHHLTPTGQQIWQRLEGMLAASEEAAERQITNGVASKLYLSYLLMLLLIHKLLMLLTKYIALALALF